MYLADVRPKNLLRGQDVKVYLREDNKTIYKEIEVPHIIPSYKFENKVADTHLENLRKGKDAQGILFEQKRHKGNTVIHAKGSRDMKERLPNIFLKSESSPTDMVRWQTQFPFSQVKEEYGKLIFSEKKIDMQTLINEKAVAVDLEVEGWREAKETGDPTKERIAMASFTTMSEYGNFILSLYDLGVTEVEAHGQKARVIVCKDEQELIQKLSQMFNDFDPLWIFGSNVGGYDLLKLREKGGDVFKPSIDGDEPKIEARCGFFPRVTIRGRQVIDSAPFSQNWLWLPNNKLTTVANELLNEKEEKDIDYDELDASFKSKDPGRLAKVAVYNFKDALRSFSVGKKMLPTVVFQSKLFAASPSSVCTTSKKSLGKKIHEKRYFERYRTVTKKRIEEEYDNFNLDRLKYEIWDKECGNSVLSVKRGIFKDVSVVFLTPFIEAFRDVLKKQEAYNEIFGQQLGIIDRIIICQAINSFLEKPIFDLNKVTRFDHIHSAYDIQEKMDKAFGYSYDIYSTTDHHSGEWRVNNIQMINNKILDIISKTNELLRSSEIINYSDKFIFIKDSMGVAEKLQERGFGRSLGKASVLSAEKGRVLFSLNDSKSGKILSQDADASGTKGNRTLFEQELISEFGKLVLIDKAAALRFIWDMAKEFAEDRIVKEKLVYLEEEVRQDYFNYSAPAQLQERIATYIKYGVKKGESFGYGYGNEKANASRPNEGGIIKIPEFFSKDVEVEKAMYLDKWYGPKTKNGRSFARGTIGDFVYSAFPVTTEEDRKELGKVVEGKRDAHIDRFFREQLKLF